MKDWKYLVKMDLGNDNFDFGKLTTQKSNIENVTPHKLAVVAFIREFGFLKIEGELNRYHRYPIITQFLAVVTLLDRYLVSCYRQDD